MLLADADSIELVFAVVFYGSPVLLLLGTWLIGRAIHARHVKSLHRREADVGRRILVSNEKRLPEFAAAAQGMLVTGTVVVGTDYFKRFLAGWRTLFGGRMKSIEPVLMRARREAVLRMLERADAWGANFVLNVRLDTSVIGITANDKQRHAMVEVLAYGTAIKSSVDTSPYGLAEPPVTAR